MLELFDVMDGPVPLGVTMFVSNAIGKSFFGSCLQGMVAIVGKNGFGAWSNDLRPPRKQGRQLSPLSGWITSLWKAETRLHRHSISTVSHLGTYPWQMMYHALPQKIGVGSVV